MSSLPISGRAERERADAPRLPMFIDSVSMRQQSTRDELAASLSAPHASIAPKFFYDRLGSALFTGICELAEYYPTRTEAGILQRSMPEIAQAIGPGATLIDLGAGDCQKAARMFAACSPAQYVAVDISVEFVRHALESLQLQFPDLPMIGLGLDFSRELRLPAPVSTERRVFFYPGSSIGNFTPTEASRFLLQMRRQLDRDGGLLIGVDLVKPAGIVELAYDDPLGVTAAFNLNVLNNVNRVLDSDFSVADWEHVAFYNAGHGRIEMHLRARRSVRVTWPEGSRQFEAGAMIHTENSYKYSRLAFETLLRQAGFKCERCWTDEREWFGVFYARAG
jgi:dimethylhistidine N-methyltransferase